MHLRLQLLRSGIDFARREFFFDFTVIIYILKKKTCIAYKYSNHWNLIFEEQKWKLWPAKTNFFK